MTCAGVRKTCPAGIPPAVLEMIFIVFIAAPPQLIKIWPTHGNSRQLVAVKTVMTGDNDGGGMTTTGRREDWILKKRHLHRLKDTIFFEMEPYSWWRHHASEIDPYILAQCHFRTSPHGVSKLTFTQRRATTREQWRPQTAACGGRQRQANSGSNGEGKSSEPVFFFDVHYGKVQYIGVLMAGQFMAPIRRQKGVSRQLSYLRSHQKRNTQVGRTTGTQHVRNVSDMHVDSSLQKNGKISKSTSNRPVCWQIWDNLGHPIEQRVIDKCLTCALGNIWSLVTPWSQCLDF